MSCLLRRHVGGEEIFDLCSKAASELSTWTDCSVDDRPGRLPERKPRSAAT
jgi:hypothetical protein